ncbi:MAG TPA: RDD family protein [Terriglobales bacterium]|nr:RDD family protein [Terriglobales bacterium]
MACPLCGDRCTCSAAGLYQAGEHTAVLIDPDSNRSFPTETLPSESTEQQFAASLESPGTYSRPRVASMASSRVAVGHAATATADPAFYRPDGDAPEAQGKEWRTEIAQRVQAHKARRGRKFAPDASLSFGFGNDEALEMPDRAAIIQRVATQSETIEELPTAPSPATPRMYRRIDLEPKPEESGILIEFPRPAEQQSFIEELAEPMLDGPRILDVQEEPAPVMQSADGPLLSSIRLDEDGEREVPDWIRNYRDQYEEAELELPLQVAPLKPRAISAAIDSALVLTATAIFCVIVLSITKFIPQGKAATLTAIVLTAAFWLCYHYIFLAYCGLTPGMQVAQLELCSFEGCYPLKKMRTARALAMGVSCMSLGMGFAWSLVDEDSLGWHDRITRTYLRQS